MRRRYPMFLAVLGSMLLMSCSSPPHLSGYLYAFSNNSFTVTDLNTGQIIARFSGPETVNFRYASKIDDQTILLSGSGVLTNGRSVGIKHSQGTTQFSAGVVTAWLYNRFTGTLVPYRIPARYHGLGMPIYMPKYKSLLFYCVDNQLCRVPIDNPDDVSIVDDGSQDKGVGGYGYYPIVSISDDEVVYGTNNDTAKYYNLATTKTGYLPLRKCVPQLWRFRSHQLLCAVFHPNARYYFVKLDGTGVTHAPNFNGMPAFYMLNYDTVLAGGSELTWEFLLPSEWSALRSYNLTNGSVHKFASGSWAYQGGVIWFPDVPNSIPGIHAERGTASP